MQSCGNISRALGHCHRETTHLVAFLGISFKGYLKMCGVFRTTFQSNVGYFSVVQSLNRVWLFGTLWTAGHQAPLSSTISWSLLRFMSLELVMLSNHLFFCCPFPFCLQFSPASGSFPMRWLFALGGRSIGASASASGLPMNIQGWFPLGSNGLISLLSKGLSSVFSSTQCETIDSSALSLTSIYRLGNSSSENSSHARHPITLSGS